MEILAMPYFNGIANPGLKQTSIMGRMDMVPSGDQMEAVHGRTFKWAGLAVLGCLLGLSLWLGVNRLFQVDEVQYAALARFMATGRLAFVPAYPIILVGPLTWLAGAARDSMEVLVLLRLPFVLLLWVNALLLVKATGARLRSREGLALLLLASTLGPMWDYGFEIRHDVPLLTVTLGLWCLIRSERLPAGPRLFLAAVLGGLAQLIAFKGFMFALPLLALGVHLARPKGLRSALGLLAWILGGLAAGLLAGAALHGAAGTLTLALETFRGSSHIAVNQVERIRPWFTLKRLFFEAPLLVASAFGLLVAPVLIRKGQGWRAFLAAPWFPEWFFAALAVAMLLANPTPFPYNLIHVVPALFLLVVRFRGSWGEALARLGSPERSAVLAALVLLHGLPWAMATFRHLDMDNQRQHTVISLAEALTDPARHRVFDGSGLVSNRDPLSRDWLIHTFTHIRFKDGSLPTVRSLLAQNATPVILPNYRLNWLPQEDTDFIGAHYVALANDFLVLGTMVEGGTSPWEALAEGRYQMELVPGPEGSTNAFGLDGQEGEARIAVLRRGAHTFQVPAGRRLRVAWLGPVLGLLPALPPAPHPLFINWY
jgi:hypothetical protein